MTTGWRLGRRPALDGLRGVAILLVLTGHLFPRHFAAGGVVGVTVFFTLSGFLITSLLLEERDRSGRVDLRAFYLRRARRLLPALFVFLAVMLALGLAVSPRLATPEAVLRALFYVANFGPTGSGIGHTWSLSVEEQFYVLFPLLLIGVLGRWGRRALVWVLIGGVVLSAIARLLLWSSADPGRVYHGTMTNAGGLLLGCLFAVTVEARAERVGASGFVVVDEWLDRFHVVLLALVALVALGAVPDGEFVRQWVAVPASVLAAVALRSSLDGSWLLSARWLTLVGRRSYALYLWHFPLVYVIGRDLNVGWRIGLALLAWGLAVASWRFVEAPFLRSREEVLDPIKGLPELPEAGPVVEDDEVRAAGRGWSPRRTAWGR